MKAWILITFLVIFLGFIGIGINSLLNPPVTWKYKLYSVYPAILGFGSLIVIILYLFYKEMTKL